MKKIFMLTAYLAFLLGLSYLTPTKLVHAAETTNVLANIPTTSGNLNMTDGNYSTYSEIGGPNYATNVYIFKFPEPVDITRVTAYDSQGERMSLSDIVSLYNSNEELIGSGISNVFSAKNVSILKYEYPRNLGPFKVYELEATGTLSVPSTAPVNLKAASGNSQVTLSWNAVDSAESYIVHYGTSSGNYTKTAVAIKDENGSFIISGLSNGTTYYFVVSSVVGGVESDFSNEAVATPQAVTQPNDPTPSGDRAILTITMTTGLQKEYDLSMDEINAFINWYDTKDAGSGPSKYAISKHDNNKGPFSKRTDYVIFNNILTFEVNEYNTVTAVIYK